MCALSLLVLLQGCAADTGIDRLSELMYSEYCADVDFVLSDGTENIEGKATVTKGETVKIAFMSPECFEGMTVENDGNGQTGNVYFTYYGMKVPLPENAFTKINLVMSFFSDETAMAVSSLPKKEIFDMPEYSQDKNISAKKCVFTTSGGETSVCLVYNATDGSPLEYSARNGIYTADIKFNGFGNK